MGQLGAGFFSFPISFVSLSFFLLDYFPFFIVLLEIQTGKGKQGISGVNPFPPGFNTISFRWLKWRRFVWTNLAAFSLSSIAQFPDNARTSHQSDGIPFFPHAWLSCFPARLSLFQKLWSCSFFPVINVVNDESIEQKYYPYSLHLAIGNCDDDGDIESLPSSLSLQDSGILGFACDDHNKLCAVPLSICFMCANVQMFQSLLRRRRRGYVSGVSSHLTESESATSDLNRARAPSCRYLSVISEQS